MDVKNYGFPLMTLLLSNMEANTMISVARTLVTPILERDAALNTETLIAVESSTTTVSQWTVLVIKSVALATDTADLITKPLIRAFSAQ